MDSRYKQFTHVDQKGFEHNMFTMEATHLVNAIRFKIREIVNLRAGVSPKMSKFTRQMLGENVSEEAAAERAQVVFLSLVPYLAVASMRGLNIPEIRQLLELDTRTELTFEGA